jgi:hypothetical protein
MDGTIIFYMKVGVFKDPCWRAIKTKLRRRNGETIKTMALTIFKEEQLGNQSTRQLGTESLPQDSKNKSSQQRQADSAAGASRTGQQGGHSLPQRRSNRGVKQSAGHCTFHKTAEQAVNKEKQAFPQRGAGAEKHTFLQIRNQQAKTVPELNQVGTTGKGHTNLQRYKLTVKTRQSARN